MRNSRKNRASGLVIVLAVLALLSIMATTFVTLMRLDIRTTTNYVDDQRCEMLARGMATYIQGILRDDSNRTWGRYTNRTASAGSPGSILGMNGWAWGTFAGRSFWFTSPYMAWAGWGNRYDAWSMWGIWGASSDSFIGMYSTIGRYREVVGDCTTGQTRTIEVDALVDRLGNYRANTNPALNPYGIRVVGGGHPLSTGVAIDDDGDGNATPYDSGNRASGSNPCYTEVNSGSIYYYDQQDTTLHKDFEPMFPGVPFTGETRLPGGLYWRWSLNLGYGHSMYLDMNTAGNLDGGDQNYLNNIGGLGLMATRAYDETYIPGGKHLGRIEWKGFPSDSVGSFPRYYDAVAYHPSQVSLERLLARNTGGYNIHDLWIPIAKAKTVIQHRWGADGIPADGSDRYRVGWRRDGATYYRLPSPENPQGNDQYLTVSDSLEHDHASYHPYTSFMASVFTPTEEAELRPFITCGAVDTILRGKIWPTEGYLPWRQNGVAGDWRHIDILKRVNINIIGARGPEGLLGEDAVLKTRWAAKAQRERDRLYFMLVAAMNYTNTPNAQHLACQFIASLTDMVDRDNNETYYLAPDGSGNWALGVEKFPVINEVAVYLTSANSANYVPAGLRVELYNPAENIPWIPDSAEAYDISNYILRVQDSLGAELFSRRLGDLYNYGTNVAIAGTPGVSHVTTIGADGLYGITNDATGRTYSRYVQLGGWNGPANMASDWPSNFTNKLQIEGRTSLTTDQSFKGFAITLWKPLAGDALGTPLGTNVQLINGVKCLCVDTTGVQQFIQPYGFGMLQGPGPGYSRSPTNVVTNYLTIVTDYRRWDPMNAKSLYAIGDMSNYGKNDASNLIWCPGWKPGGGWFESMTLGKPNSTYANSLYTVPTASPPVSSMAYERRFEKSFKVVDGDLPSIGWLGELILKNPAQDGLLTMIHSKAQVPGPNSQPDPRYPSNNDLDCKAKFDLFRPFQFLGTSGVNIPMEPMPPNPFRWPTGQETRSAIAAKTHPENLHILDIFTVWDPSNDGVDNDGDGAVDDDDTGCQPGDKNGPEVRVFGKIDLNWAPHNVLLSVFPDNPDLSLTYALSHIPNSGSDDGGIGPCRWGVRGGQVGGNLNSGHGPYETIGDLLRVDGLSTKPGGFFNGGTILNASVNGVQLEDWFEPGVNNGSGIIGGRDQRDAIFTWVANYFTTRDNVFEMNLNVDLVAPPYYPGRKLPFTAYRTRTQIARKQILGLIDRSTTLRIAPDGSCDFSGPVRFQMLRFSDDMPVY